MLVIIFSSLAILSVIILLYLVIKKFPQLSNLDTSSLPQEKIVQTKKNIINKRVSQQGGLFRSYLGKIFIPILDKYWKKLQSNFRHYVDKIYKLWQHESIAQTKIDIETSGEKKDDKIQQLLNEAEESMQNNRLDEAENYYISIISLDEKNISAYRGLAEIYLNKKELEEARQTFLFLTRMEPDDDTSLIKLAEIAESQGDIEEAIEYYQKAVLVNDAVSPRFYHLAELLLKVEQPEVAKEAIVQAVELEPQNPRYLDLLIENAIICGDKSLALEGYNNLRTVNADNHKLDGFKDRIDHLKIKNK